MRPAEELRYLILAAQREGNRQLGQALRPLGVTPPQADVLRPLADRQPLTLSGVGELLVCESGTNPSRLVDRLVTAGLVRRVEAAQDRRQVELTLTAAGRHLAGTLIGVRGVWRRGRRRSGPIVRQDPASSEQLIQHAKGVAGSPAGGLVARRTG